MIDVLNLEWSGQFSRDQQMATLVCNYLTHMGYNVKQGSVFDGYYLLNRYKPKVFFITNTLGAKVNIDLVRYAKERGISIVSLISEGNFRDGYENVKEFVWGWNKEQKLYEDVHMQWSTRTRDMTLNYFPELSMKIKVSGGVGFDVYKIAKQTDQFGLLKKYQKHHYDKVIGVGCWDFGVFYDDDHRFPFYNKNYSKETIARFRKDGLAFNYVLKEIIEKYKDTLFLLKEHPGVLGGRVASAIDGLDKFDNVLILKREEIVFDCIAVSDFWLAYESTTTMEAWLMGRQTCLLNPSGKDFPRDDLHKGSPIFRSTEDLSIAVESFYKNKSVPGFSDLEKERKKLIRDIIQWDDGFNHVRAGNEIIELVNKLKQNTITTFFSKNIVLVLKTHILWVLCPYARWIHKSFKFIYNHKKNFDSKELKVNRLRRMEQQVQFYSDSGKTKESLSDIRCI